ncbi:MAG: 16S rRNA (uracil(1498)-N(3))-methyltransferase, partial [Actinomycetota bacterium]|nr:16S rRNA (uracil(1498)-N(3))-methyltransferase [Actinomycetota bacterium]
EEEAHHVYKVLRGRTGESIEVVDGAGRLFVAELLKGREASVTEEQPAEGDDTAVTLYQAAPKGRHMDLVVEKATELGVGRVVPLVTERGVVRFEEGDGKVRRWRRVAETAARQSLRLRVPEVGEALPFSEAVREVGETGVLLHNGPNLPPLEGIVPGLAVGLFVGPEGGWSERELAMAGEAGLRFASLGPYRLRSETAGIVAVARVCAVQERMKSAGGKATGSEVMRMP